MRRRSGQKRPLLSLLIALLLAWLGSFVAGRLHSGMLATHVSRVAFETERGVLTGSLYVPRSASATNPRPAIVTTHGYLGARETQSAMATELSRRGYVVLSLDLYDHGHAKWTAPIHKGSAFSTFWPHTVYDGVNYLYRKDFVQKDANGNGLIAVSGHAMGGFSALLSIYFDEQNAQTTGYRMIHAGLSVGADLSYTAMFAPRDQLLAAFGSRAVGIVAGQYDEFFFDKSPDEMDATQALVGGSMVQKAYTNTLSGRAFLGRQRESISAADTYYTVESGDFMHDGTIVRGSQPGEHIVFMPSEISPYHPISSETITNAIDFFSSAFGDSAPFTTLSATDHIWPWKEAASLVSLIGFLLMIAPIASLLLRLPFLRRAISTARPPRMIRPQRSMRIFLMLASLLLGLAPALLYPHLMDQAAPVLDALCTLSLVLAGICAIGAAVLTLTGLRYIHGAHAFSMGLFCSGIVLLLCFCFLRFMPGRLTGDATPALPAPIANQVVFFLCACGMLSLLTTVGTHHIQKPQTSASHKSYGLVFSGLSIAASFATALLTLFIALLVLFVLQSVYLVDFRLWTFAVRTFDATHLRAALTYAPLFFLFFASGAIALGGRFRKHRKQPSRLLSIWMHGGGLFMFLLAQYGSLFVRGAAWLPNQAMNTTLLLSLLPCLCICALLARSLLACSKNIWLPAFFNTMFFTLMLLSNTVLHAAIA